LNWRVFSIDLKDASESETVIMDWIVFLVLSMLYLQYYDCESNDW